MLAGYLAASWSKSGKIGTYGGLAFPGVTRFMDGLYAGIQYYNQQKTPATPVKLLGWDGSQKDPTKTGTFVGGSGGNDTWGDPAKGEQLAKTFLDQGVDIVHPVAGATGNGTIKWMSQQPEVGHRRRHGPVHQHRSSDQRCLLTSAQKAIDVSVLDFFNQVAGGYLGGTDYSGTIANNGVLLAPFHDYDSQISADVKAELDALEGKLADGSVKVCTFLGRGC